MPVWIRRASDERRRALTSTAFVSEEKETSARGRLVGIARAVHRRSRLRVSFSCLVCFPLVVVLWCVGNPDLWDRGLVCFWGTFLLWLVYPNLPIAWAQARARITHSFPLVLQCLFVSHNSNQFLFVTVLRPFAFCTCILHTSSHSFSAISSFASPACTASFGISGCW